jgi:hypothetical protein
MFDLKNKITGCCDFFAHIPHPSDACPVVANYKNWRPAHFISGEKTISILGGGRAASMRRSPSRNKVPSGTRGSFNAQCRLRAKQAALGQQKRPAPSRKQRRRNRGVYEAILGINSFACQAEFENYLILWDT